MKTGSAASPPNCCNCSPQQHAPATRLAAPAHVELPASRGPHLGGRLRLPRGAGRGEQAAWEGRRRGRRRRWGGGCKRRRGAQTWGPAAAASTHQARRCMAGVRRGQLQRQVGGQRGDHICHAVCRGCRRRCCGRHRLPGLRHQGWAGLAQVPPQRGQQSHVAPQLVNSPCRWPCSSRQLQLGQLLGKGRAPAKGCTHERPRGSCRC